MKKEYLNAAHAISLAFEFVANHPYGNTTIGFELLAEGGRQYNFVLYSDDINLETIIEKTDLHDFGCMEEIAVYDLHNKEYKITQFGIEIKQGWQRLYELVREYGKYVVISGDDIFEIEYKIEGSRPFAKRTFTDFKNVVKRLENAITSKMQVLYVPPYHMWKKYSYEIYPDDPGCGIYGYYVKVFDKATGVEYKPE